MWAKKNNKLLYYYINFAKLKIVNIDKINFIYLYDYVLNVLFIKTKLKLIKVCLCNIFKRRSVYFLA